MAIITGLIGYTGLVGSNLSKQYNFTHKYNSKNIDSIEKTSFDLLVCAAAQGEKWFANKFPENDLKSINKLIDILQKTKSKMFVLISTVDVYDNLIKVDEKNPINLNNLSPYGQNRYRLEEFVSENFKKHAIVRLPALFGEGIKKNLIYDLLMTIPSAIPLNLYDKVITKPNDTKIIKCFEESYSLDDFNYLRINKRVDPKNISLIRDFILTSELNPLNKINPNSSYQYFDLSSIWRYINLVLRNRLDVVNLVTEPINNREVVEKVFKIKVGYNFDQPELHYDIRSIYSKLLRLSSNNGYLYSEGEVLDQLNTFTSNFDIHGI